MDIVLPSTTPESLLENRLQIVDTDASAQKPIIPVRTMNPVTLKDVPAQKSESATDLALVDQALQTAQEQPRVKASLRGFYDDGVNTAAQPTPQINVASKFMEIPQAPAKGVKGSSALSGVYFGPGQSQLPVGMGASENFINNSAITVTNKQGGDFVFYNDINDNSANGASTGAVGRTHVAGETLTNVEYVSNFGGITNRGRMDVLTEPSVVTESGRSGFGGGSGGGGFGSAIGAGSNIVPADAVERPVDRFTTVDGTTGYLIVDDARETLNGGLTTNFVNSGSMVQGANGFGLAAQGTTPFLINGVPPGSVGQSLATAQTGGGTLAFTNNSPAKQGVIQTAKNTQPGLNGTLSSQAQSNVYSVNAVGYTGPAFRGTPVVIDGNPIPTANPAAANPAGFFPGTAYIASPDGLIPAANTLVPSSQSDGEITGGLVRRLNTQIASAKSPKDSATLAPRFGFNGDLNDAGQPVVTVHDAENPTGTPTAGKAVGFNWNVGNFVVGSAASDSNVTLPDKAEKAEKNLFANGLTKDDVSSLRYLSSTNGQINLATTTNPAARDYPNGTTYGTITTSIEPGTGKVFVVGDARAVESIDSVIKNLDRPKETPSPLQG